MSARERYRRLCREDATIPLFSRDWWLDTVCGDEGWDVVLAERGGAVAGALPFHRASRFGFTFVRMPRLTQCLGPWLAYPAGQKYHARLSYEKEVMGELIAGLPRCDHFVQNFHRSVTNWLPFHWQGFRQTTRYSYVIPDLTDLDAVFEEFRSNVRTDIRKAEKTVTVAATDDLEEFHRINSLTFARQGGEVPYDLPFLARLDAACRERGCRRILRAVDAAGRVHAAVYLAWDDRTTYYLMGGGDPELRNSGATSLLIREAIRFAATVSREFDFEGSMIEPVERFFRAFGAVQTPYSQVSRTPSRLLALAYCLKELRRGAAGRGR